MKAADFAEFAALMGQTAEVYGKERPSAGALKVMAAALAAYPVADVRRALSVHVRRSKFMPRPADLIEILEGTAEDRARAAWQTVLNALRRHGAYASVAFGDPLIHYAIERLGSWIALSGMERQAEPFREKDFVSWYGKGERAGISWGDVPARLPGLHELNNRNAAIDPARLGLAATYTGDAVPVGGGAERPPIEGSQAAGLAALVGKTKEALTA